MPRLPKLIVQGVRLAKLAVSRRARNAHAVGNLAAARSRLGALRVRKAEAKAELVGRHHGVVERATEFFRRVQVAVPHGFESLSSLNEAALHAFNGYLDLVGSPGALRAQVAQSKKAWLAAEKARSRLVAELVQTTERRSGEARSVVWAYKQSFLDAERSRRYALDDLVENVQVQIKAAREIGRLDRKVRGFGGLPVTRSR